MQSTEQLLREIAAAHRGILGANLVGIYLHGSLAFGCFHPRTGDIDYLVVADEPLSPEDKLRIMERTVRLNARAPEKGLEMSVVLRDNCREFVYPTPYELHFSAMHLDRYRRSPRSYCRDMQGDDADLAAHVAVIRHCGIVLWGAPVDEVFGPVPRAAYLDSIRRDIANAEQEVCGNPVSVLLNLCRAAAAVREDRILSKPDGGRWALRHVPAAYRALIQSAVRCYEEGHAQCVDPALAVDFCRYMNGIVS